MPTELAVIVALIVVNGLFAGAEIAILNVRGTQVRQRAERRDRRAMAVQTLRDKPERFLATVQIGITVVSTAAAAFGGASIARTLAPVFADLGFGDYADDAAFASVIAGISILSLVLGELVPKSLALRYSSVYAFLVSRPLLGLSRLAAPLVWFLTSCSNLVLRLFGDRTSFAESRMSRDELQQLVQDAAKTGSVDTKSSEIAARALELEDVAVGEVMVLREDIVGIPRTASPADVQRILLEEGHSRMPVYGRDVEDIVGYVVARDVLALAWEQGLVVLDDIIRPLIHVPVTMKVPAVLRLLQAKSVQIALVVDEHAGVAGLVTIEDLIEELVGDIRNEDEAPEEDVVVQPDGSALVPGWMPTRKVNRALHLDLPITRDATTIAGLCLVLALAIPAVGTRLRARDGTMLEVVDASQKRVRMVRVIQAPRDDEARDDQPTA